MSAIGALVFLLLLAGIVCSIVLPIIFICENYQKKENKNKVENNTNITIKNNTTEIYDNYSKYYIAKKYLNTRTETRFYNELIKITVNLNLLVSTQVSLYNIVQVRNIKERQKYFNKISKKSIDYVITKKNTNEIVCCIELDDYTHKYQKRIERDKFINKLFKDVGIKLYRIKVSNYYNLENLGRELEERISKII